MGHERGSGEALLQCGAQEAAGRAAPLWSTKGSGEAGEKLAQEEAAGRLWSTRGGSGGGSAAAEAQEEAVEHKRRQRGRLCSS